MNKLYILIFCFSFLWITNACDNEDVVYPSEISQLTAEARKGAIMLRWNVPQDSSYLYVKLEYFSPRKQKNIVRNVSVYVDSLLVDDLLAKDGEYDFKLRTVSETGDESGTSLEARCTALPVDPVTTTHQELLDNVEIVSFSTNAQEPTEGPVSNLFDGDKSTFFHTPWSMTVDYPQYVQINLSEPVNAAQLVTYNRSGSKDGHADHVEILGSNDEQTWDLLYEFWGSKDIPAAGGGRYESPLFSGDKKYKYLRYNALSGMDGHTWWNMAEMEWSFYNVWEVIYDPENE